MTAALLALVLSATPPSLTLKYDLEVTGAAHTSVTLRAQGPRLRIDADSTHMTVVKDDARKVMTFTGPKPGVCYELPYAKLPEFQVLAIRRYQKSQSAYFESLSPPDRLAWRSHFDKAVSDVRNAKPRVQTLTWLKSEKLERPCELYQVTEAGADVGTICLQVTGAAPKSLTLTASPGEWWQGANVYLAQGFVPVQYEQKRNGVVQSRASLVSLDRAAFPASVFVLGKHCESGLALDEGR